MTSKSQIILRAISRGDSFAEILATDASLGYHDIFRAAAEVSSVRLGGRAIQAAVRLARERAASESPPRADDSERLSF